MAIYKRYGSDNWYMYYRDADGNLRRKSTGTTNKKEAEALLSTTLAKVAATKRERWMMTADELGLDERQVGPLDERVLRLEDMIGRIIRLHVVQYEVLREWIEDEKKIRDEE